MSKTKRRKYSNGRIATLIIFRPEVKAALKEYAEDRGLSGGMSQAADEIFSKTLRRTKHLTTEGAN